MTQTTQASQSKYETTSKRIESQHEELLQKLDELDKQIQIVLDNWGSLLEGNDGNRHSK